MQPIKPRRRRRNKFLLVEKLTRTAKYALLTHDYLRSLFRHDRSRGILIWQTRPRHHFKSAAAQRSFNNRLAGKCTGSFYTDRSGARRRRVVIPLPHSRGHLGVNLSRIIFRMAHGYWPELVDHINRDPLINVLSNLRAASPGQNQQNRRVGKNSRTGIVGVSPTVSGKYCAAVGYHGKQYRKSGLTFAEACRVRARLKRKYHQFHPHDHEQQRQAA